MSLFDIDKTSSDRSQPSLNVDDVHTARMAHGTLAITLADTSSSVKSRTALGDGKVEVYNSSDERIARLGVRETDTEGAVDVAKPGQNL